MLHTTPDEQTAIARRHDTAGPLAVATPTIRKLAEASISVNTTSAYLGALTRVDAWRGDDPLTDPGPLTLARSRLRRALRAPFIEEYRA